MRIEVDVPATTSNLGPGFDSMGLALEMFSTFCCESTDNPGLSIRLEGEGVGELPLDQGNLVVRSIHAFFERHGRQVPGLHLHLANRVPLSAGLGSSATAIVGGGAIASELLGQSLDDPDNRRALVAFASQQEGHPDNAAPCVLGGFVASARDGEQVHSVRFEAPNELGVVLATPQMSQSTAELRAALPDTVRFDDAIYNVGHVATLVAALCQGRLDLLDVTMRDRLHQHVRTAPIAGFDQVVEAARSAGALTAVLSGAGATVIAYTDRRHEREADIARAMGEAFESAGMAATTVVTTPRSDGVVVRHR